MLATDYRLSQPELFRQDVIAGLSMRRKAFSCRWLYDERGSELFEQITQLEEYYPTRVETGILRSNAAEMAAFIGKGATLIEYGAGAGIKTEILIAALEAPRLYVPVDISGDFLDQAVISLRHPFERAIGLLSRFDDRQSGLRRDGFFPSARASTRGIEGNRRHRSGSDEG